MVEMIKFNRLAKTVYPFALCATAFLLLTTVVSSLNQDEKERPNCTDIDVFFLTPENDFVTGLECITQLFSDDDVLVLQLYNRSWSRNYTFDCVEKIGDPPYGRWVLELERKNFTTDSLAWVPKEEWWVTIELQSSNPDAGNFTKPLKATLFDIATEPILQWVLGIGATPPAVNPLYLRIISSPCAYDAKIAIAQFTRPGPIYATVSSSAFVYDEFNAWYKLDLCGNDECNVIDAAITNYYLIVFTNKTVHVSNDLRDSASVGGVRINKITFTDGFDFKKISKPPSGTYCSTSSIPTGSRVTSTRLCLNRFHDPFQEDIVTVIFNCTAEEHLVLISSSTDHFTAWTQNWIHSDMPTTIASITFNPHTFNLAIVFSAHQLQANDTKFYSRFEVRSLDVKGSQLIGKTPIFKPIMFEDRISQIRHHPLTNTLHAYGQSVYQSLDGGNSFKSMYTFIDYDPQYPAIVVDGYNVKNGVSSMLTQFGPTELDKRTLCLGKTGVQRFAAGLLDSYATECAEAYGVANFESNVQLSFDALMELYALQVAIGSDSVLRIKACNIDIKKFLTASDIAFPHALLVQIVSQSSAIVYEYRNAIGDQTGFHDGYVGLQMTTSGTRLTLHIDEINAVTDRLASYGFLIQLRACILTASTGAKSTTDIVFKSFNVASGETVFSVTSGVSASDVKKTLVIPFIGSILITSVSGATVTGVSASIIGIPADTVIPAGKWYLLNFGLKNANTPAWSLKEVPRCGHFVTTNLVYTMYDLDMDNTLDFDVIVTLGDMFSIGTHQITLTGTLSNSTILRSQFRLEVDGDDRTAILCMTVAVDSLQRGMTTVSITTVGASLSCEESSIIFTIFVGCFALRRLNFLYPAQLLPEQWKLDQLIDKATKSNILYHLPYYYRPPSEYGYNVPTTNNTYNVDPSQPKPSYFFDISKTSGTLKQCAHVNNRKECGCTQEMELTDDIIYSDCKTVVYRLLYPGKLNLTFNLQIDENVYESIRENYLFSIRDLNNRRNFKVIELSSSVLLDELRSHDETKKEAMFYYIPNMTQIEMIGSGLYHFRVEVFRAVTFCPFYSEFMVYVDGASIPHPVNYVINFAVALILGIILLILGSYRYYRARGQIAYRRTLTGKKCRDLDMSRVVGMYPPHRLVQIAASTEERRRRAEAAEAEALERGADEVELSATEARPIPRPLQNVSAAITPLPDPTNVAQHRRKSNQESVSPAVQSTPGNSAAVPQQPPK